MYSLLWQLVLGAGRQLLVDWGTSLLGWLLIFLIPVGVLAIKARRAEKGKIWTAVWENWREEVRDVFLVTLAFSALIFLYELFVGEPTRISKQASEISPPPLLLRAPPLPTSESRSHIVLPPFVKEEVFMTLIPFPSSEAAALPFYEPDITKPFDPHEAATGDITERYDGLISFGVQAMKSRGKGEPWDDEQVQGCLGVALQYYIIHQIERIESGAIGNVIVGQGKTASIAVSGNRPPDEVWYPGEQFIQAIYPNRLSRTQFERKWWSRGYKVPRSTEVTLHNTPENVKPATLTMRMESPNLYFVEITISSNFGPSNNLPFGYRPYPGLDESKVSTFPYTVKCHFEFKRRPGTDNLQEEEYAKWADDIFAALKKNLAN
jgi:hypothetical protein